MKLDTHIRRDEDFHILWVVLVDLANWCHPQNFSSIPGAAFNLIVKYQTQRHVMSTGNQHHLGYELCIKLAFLFHV